MKKKALLLLGIPLLLIGCNGNKVDLPKSPFSNDNYKRIGMESEYKDITISDLNSEEYDKLKKSIKDYKNYDAKVKSYTRSEETRDLKAAYFGTNLGAANLCKKTSRTDTNTRYNNLVTTKLVNTKTEEQVMNSKSTIKNEQQMDDYVNGLDGEKYSTIRSLKNNTSNPEVTYVVKEESYSGEGKAEEVFGTHAYEKDIKNNFVIKSRTPGREISFSVLADNNNAVYGKTNIKDIGERYIIREAMSDFSPYSTTVGDTHKAVDNYFYEALLVPENGGYRFTNFRFYHELLILSEAYGDESKVPVLYLEKPVLVEYSEIKYTIDYTDKGEFNKGNIPTPTK